MSSWGSWSLRRRLTLIFAGALSTALVVGGVAVYWAAQIEDDQMRDARLEQVGSTILSLVDDELVSASASSGTDKVQALEHKTRPTAALLYRYQVWTTNGALLLRSHEAPANRSFVELTRLGFTTVTFGGEEYRTFTLPSRDGRFVIQVAECLDEQVGQLAVAAGRTLLFMVIPFALILIATSLLLRGALAPIHSVAAQLTDRNPLDVAKLQVESPPQELLPVLRSFDALMERIRHAISIERRFTSVAAHEMRTPLAGLRAHAQLAVEAASTEESRAALDAVIHGVDRASHLLNQLLDIARIEGMVTEGPPFKEVEVAAIFDDALRDMLPLAKSKGIRIETELRLEKLRGSPLSLLLIVRNLVANAVLYCPRGGQVRLFFGSAGGRPTLVVDDSGPGISEADRERAFERFNRLGQRDTEGVGLGLSIVLMAVELHRAKISLLDSPLGGLRCQISFVATTTHDAAERVTSTLAATEAC